MKKHIHKQWDIFWMYSNHTMTSCINHVHVRTSVFGFAQVGTWCISMSHVKIGPSRSRLLMIELIDVSWRIPVLSSVKYNSCAVSIPSLKLPKRKRSYSNHPFSGRTVSFRELCQRKYVIYTYHTPTKNTNKHTHTQHVWDAQKTQPCSPKKHNILYISKAIFLKPPNSPCVWEKHIPPSHHPVGPWYKSMEGDR